MREKQIWQIGTTDQAVLSLSKELGISAVLARVLGNRGFKSADAVKAFLRANMDDLQDPLVLPGMQEGMARVYQAITQGEHILIYGDYDVDGITAVAVLYSFLQQAGGRVSYYIPQRLEEGYGLNIEALDKAKAQGIDLVLTVDCGIAAVEEVRYASSLGLEMVITDHHEPPEILPQAQAIINPKLADSLQPWSELAGVGVAFKLAQALGKPFGLEAYCLELLDLVALGTIADIVPLRNENRILVKEGLKRLQNSARPGVAALLAVSGNNNYEVNSEAIGYFIAPRLNASGRLGKADKAVELLITADTAAAQEIACALDSENRARQELETNILEQALALLEEQVDLARDKVIVLAGQNWHHGVIGIVASRLVDKFYRPALVISVEDGVGKGSGRSIPGFNLFESLQRHKNYLLNFGGHGMAAGLSLEEAQIPAFRESLNRYAEETLTEKDLIPVLKADCEVLWPELSRALAEEIAMLAPFGYHNPCPLLILRNKQLAHCKEVGSKKNHLKMRVLGDDGYLDGIAFQKGAYKGALVSSDGYDLAVVPELNTYRGHSRLQLIIKDLKPALERDNPYIPLSFLDRLYAEGEIWLEDDYYRDIINREEFFTKAVGVTFAERQSVLSRIQDGDSAELVREPLNEYDANAVAVFWQGEQAGYLNACLSRVLAPVIDAGARYEAFVTQVTGRDKDTLGLNLCIKRTTRETDKVSLQQARTELQKLTPEELAPKIRQAVIGALPYHPKQEEALQELQAGRNTLAILATGRGKSAIFQSMGAHLALVKNQVSVIVYPLRSLVNDQLQRLRLKMAPLGVTAEAITGSMNLGEKQDFFVRLGRGEIDIVLTTPEFLSFHVDKFALIQHKIGFFVVDEAHHLAKGKRRGYRMLKSSWERLGRPLALAVTATADDETAQRIADTLLCESAIIEEHVRTNLRLTDRRGERDKLAYLLELTARGEKIVIYVNSRRQAYQLASDLRSYYPPAKEEIGFYHGGLHSEYRKSLEEMFRSGELRVMVTTSAFGEGIDIPDIRHVVLYHLSFSHAEFNQLSGRAGRNNEEAYIHILFGERDRTLNELILESAAPSRELLGKLYVLLRDKAKETNPLVLTNAELKEAMQKAGVKNFREQTASAALAILEEMGLLLREVEGGKRFIHFAPPPPGKLDLTDSVRYLEGLEEEEAFAEFAGSVLGEPEAKLLAGINKPIYPKKILRLSPGKRN
ncbi:MAG: single-stranded-DNA-specific exonuclease RecJ [Clostridia bacterium]|jgi:single-stranded-DNA-specific exonuclease|nr:single-stranded-DNA-specific exonuclease RecJ [Clostridia bacterium]